MKYLAKIWCDPKQIGAELVKTLEETYGLSVESVKEVSRTSLPDGRELIVFGTKFTNVEGVRPLFVIRSCFDDETDKFRVYGEGFVCLCPKHRWVLEAESDYCPYCGTKTVWEVW